MAVCGLPGIIRRSSCGPGLLFVRFVLGFLGISYYYHTTCLGEDECPSRGSDPDARNGHVVANHACLPVPALGHKKIMH
jgi:hypothetical protein